MNKTNQLRLGVAFFSAVLMYGIYSYYSIYGIMGAFSLFCFIVISVMWSIYMFGLAWLCVNKDFV